MKNKYSKKQIEVINNDDDYLIVSAGPGSGKTRTIVGYLENEKEMHKQIIVSSFTKNSTYEIKKRFKKCNRQMENICFQTFDSFLIEKIWKFYFNRILKWTIKICNDEFNQNIVNSKLGIQLINIEYENKSTWNKLKECLEKKDDRKWCINKVLNFINMCKQGILSIDPISEYILWQFLKQNDDIHKYLKYTFYKIIIDEAQDLNWIRHEILLIFHEKCQIKILLVGDERQTLYKFIGAKPNIFEYLLQKRNIIKKLELRKNFRYEGNNENINDILKSINENEFRKKLKCAIENEDIKLIKNNDIQNYIDKNENSINELVNLFLTSNNDNVEKISEELKKQKIKNRAILRLSNDEVKYEHKVFIENICIYDKLKNRKIKWTEKYSTLIEDIIDFIWPFDTNKNNKFLELFHNKNGINIDKIAQLTQIPNLKNFLTNFQKMKDILKMLKDKEMK